MREWLDPKFSKHPNSREQLWSLLVPARRRKFFQKKYICNMHWQQHSSKREKRDDTKHRKKNKAEGSKARSVKFTAQTNRRSDCCRRHWPSSSPARPPELLETPWTSQPVKPLADACKPIKWLPCQQSSFSTPSCSSTFFETPQPTLPHCPASVPQDVSLIHKDGVDGATSHRNLTKRNSPVKLCAFDARIMATRTASRVPEEQRWNSHQASPGSGTCSTATNTTSRAKFACATRALPRRSEAPRLPP